MDTMMNMAGGSIIIAWTTLFMNFAVQTWSQDCSPCFCCEQTGCSYNSQLGIDNYCWGGCKKGYMSPQCQKPCVNQRCQICSTGSTCDTCYEGFYGDQCCVNQRCQTCSTNTTCDSCNDGYYGDQCQSQCLTTCTTCTSSTLCTSCKNGHHKGSGTMCLYFCKTECLSCTNSTSCTACKVKSGVGYYGSDCSMICSNKCKDYLCDINGNCLQCNDPNFTGGSCDRCIDGKYGSQCKNNCPVNCLSCVSDTYCSSCKEGSEGPICQLQSECPDNCYTNTCLSTGKCESCKEDFFGEYCNKTCSQNCKYGTCYQNGHCIDGCKEWFSGQMCEEHICPLNCHCDTLNNCVGCKQHYFGRYCSHNCDSCKNNQCPEDKLTEKCDACADGTFGNLCNETCPKHCLNDRCNQDNGSCTCEHNYTYGGGICVPSECPINCSTCTVNSCDSCVNAYYYGNTCERECTHCMTGTSCGKETGYCLTACVNGFTDTNCDTLCYEGCAACQRFNRNQCSSCRTGKYGHNGSFYVCNYSCSVNCLNNSCNAMNGNCDKGCINGYKGNTCNIKCAETCLNDTCEQQNGLCVHGCVDGYYGANCNFQCMEQDSGCLICAADENTFRLCIRCKNGSYPGSSGTCVTCEPNCSDGCDSSTGVCHACVDGHKGPFCNDSCPSNCKYCQQEDGVCRLCLNEYWGTDCSIDCNLNCNRGNDSMSSCDSSSGGCKYGCRPGIHGSKCDIKCDPNCLASDDGVRQCRQTDGRCTHGCDTGYKQTDAGCIDESVTGTSGAVIGGAVGGVGAVIVVALIIGIVIFLRRRRRKGSNDGQRKDGYKAELVISKEENSVVFQNVTASTSIYDELNDTTDDVKHSKGFERNAYEQPNTKGKREHLGNGVKSKTPVKVASKDLPQDKDNGDVYYNLSKVAVKDLGAFVAGKDRSYYIEEFKKLPEGLIKPHQDAMMPENRPKNRYQGIYPYDDTRVKLTGGDTDFINASFVDGYRQENAYIASQGPTEKTMQDYSVFWRMIWQQKVGKIVMLTNLVEDGKPKCDQYWPDHGTTKQYGEINVTCLTEDMYADFVMLTFSVKMDKEDRTVQHLHFTSWPDKGVPDDVTSLVDFRHRVRQTKSPLDGPTLIHCSAGVGRTGTYMAMDVLTREGEAEGSVDIHGCVTTLRHRRTRMVQTADQYAFLHHAIVHTLTLDSTPVATEGFAAYLSDSENEQRQIKQFKQLEDISERSEQERLASERNAALTNSHREGTDIPGNLYRPRLHLGKEPGQDYINAMYVNSYKQRNNFVLAMTPLEDTVADFLCLTIQETAACIVDMEKNSSLYIPDVGTQAKFGSYTVDNLREKASLYSINRVLRISYNGRGGPKEHTVSHYEFTGWPDNAEVPESAKNFLHLVKEVETKSASGSVIAHCKTGGGRCGLFAAVWTILEKTGIEHEVSIFNTVRQLRVRRPNALCTREQYAFCYECVREYLQTFDIYSNFS